MVCSEKEDGEVLRLTEDLIFGFNFSAATRAVRLQDRERFSTDGDISESYMCLVKVNDISAASRSLLLEHFAQLALSFKV